MSLSFSSLLYLPCCPSILSPDFSAVTIKSSSDYQILLCPFCYKTCHALSPDLTMATFSFLISFFLISLLSSPLKKQQPKPPFLPCLPPYKSLQFPTVKRIYSYTIAMSIWEREGSKERELYLSFLPFFHTALSLYASITLSPGFGSAFFLTVTSHSLTKLMMPVSWVHQLPSSFLILKLSFMPHSDLPAPASQIYFLFDSKLLFSSQTSFFTACLYWKYILL